MTGYSSGATPRSRVPTRNPRFRKLLRFSLVEMATHEDYLEYLARHKQAGIGRKKLDEPRFVELAEELDRLVRRIDPDDIQLDEWKRGDELRFLLIVEDEEDNENDENDE